MDSYSETSCLCKSDITITLAVNPTEVITLTLSLTTWVRGFSALTNFGYTLYPKLNCRSKTYKTLKLSLISFKSPTHPMYSNANTNYDDP